MPKIKPPTAQPKRKTDWIRPSKAAPIRAYSASPSIAVSIGTLAKLNRAASMMSNTQPSQATIKIRHCAFVQFTLWRRYPLHRGKLIGTKSP